MAPTTAPTFDIRPIADVAADLGLAPEHVIPYGRDKAKIDRKAFDAPPRGKGRLVLVSAINPTPAGEGKTTTSIGLAMGLRRLGESVVACLREPSLGPVFGVKGGGTGGGRASLHPAEDINMHFTGDIHAITSANNLLSALVDNALHFRQQFGGKGRLDPRGISWARALDMNDRSLRKVIVGLGGKLDGIPREERFDITAASEVMAVLALARDQADLEARLGRIIVGTNELNAPITSSDLGGAKAMAAVLRDALLPNLVQTLEGGPAIVHAGPFANIAHGCNSVVATELGMRLADYVITEAGFGFDLGGEKFLDIKCRSLGVWPRALVLVATLRALKMHGGAPVKTAGAPNAEALSNGTEHLVHHLETARTLGLPAVVAINRFPDDSDAEVAQLQAEAVKVGANVVVCTGFAQGGEGGIELAKAVVDICKGNDASPPPPRFAYELSDSLPMKIEKVAKLFYGADRIELSSRAEKDIARIVALGGGELPVCVAKTQLSLTDDPTKPGRPRGFAVSVREVRLSAGAGFAVALTGDMMTMPGLPREPAAWNIHVDEAGHIRGLMQND